MTEDVTDVLIAVPVIEETRERFENFNLRSFDKGFHSSGNQKKLSEISEAVVLPREGGLSAVCREIENAEAFKAARRKHSAVESSIEALENHGPDRCPDHGLHGFKRYVSQAVSARDIQILGHVIQQKSSKSGIALKKSGAESYVQLLNFRIQFNLANHKIDASADRNFRISTHS